MAKSDDSARLIWIDSFMAAAASGSYQEAGQHLGRDPTTVSRHIDELQRWLFRYLITDDVPLEVTSDGEEFAQVGLKVSNLIDAGYLRESLSKTRVRSDGTVAIEGHKITVPEALEIGRLLIESRRLPDPNYQPRPKISAKDIDMSWLTIDPGVTESGS